MKKHISLIIVTFIVFYNLAISEDVNKKENRENSKVYVPLPGMKEKIDTEDIVQKLLYVKQIPIDKKRLELEDYRIENSIVKDFSSYLKNLSEKSRKLYDYQSPFREMKGYSPDENMIEVYATRRAKKQDYNIKIIQIAKADSFMSDPVERNKILPPSTMTIYLGNEKVNIIFKGGTISQLYQILKDAGNDLFDVRIINDTPSTSILVITGKKTGEENKIKFEGNPDTLLSIGMLKKSDEKKYEKDVYFDDVNIISGNPIITKTAISLPEATGVEKSLKEKIVENFFISFEFEENQYEVNGKKKFFTNENGELILMEPVIVSNVTVGGGSLIMDIEEKPKEIITNFIDFISIHFTNGEVMKLQPQTNGKFKFSLNEFKNNEIKKITLENRNTDREVKIANMKFYSEVEEGKFIPKNQITKASDAIFELDGVKVKRDKNSIDDVIEGVTLNLKGETTNPLKISVDYDYEKIENAILDWVDAYNKVMEYLYILTEPNLDRTPLHERKPEDLKRGVFQAESSFISLRNKLRQIPAESYNTDYGKELTVLQQAGLFTKTTGTFNANSEEWASAKMGLLQVDLEKLKSTLKTKLKGVEQLFANDLDGDMIKESGIAVKIDNNLKIAIGQGSFIEMKLASNDRKIKEGEKEIEEMNKKLADYEMELRKKYGKMNQALMESEAKQKWLNNQLKIQQ